MVVAKNMKGWDRESGGVL